MFIGSLIAQADSGMVKVSLDADVRQAEADNRMAVVEGRVDLVRQDLRHQSSRLNVVVARAAEEADASVNQRLLFFAMIFVLWAL